MEKSMWGMKETTRDGFVFVCDIETLANIISSTRILEEINLKILFVLFESRFSILLHCSRVITHLKYIYT